ncbi:MAG: hypothetical protein WCX31_20185 [Salinivirgaceae bacterium]|jgi:type IX secretion system PorP/SprF family membrane protein
MKGFVLDIKDIIQLARRTILLIAVLILSQSVQSQNLSLLTNNSQNYNINPAFTGDHPYDWNIYNTVSNVFTGFNYNLQTYNLLADYQVYFPPDKLSLAVNYMQYKVTHGPINDKMVNCTFAYHKRYRSQIFHVGIQPGIIGQALLMDQLLFPDQYDRTIGGFNGSVGTAELFENSKVYKFNINAGLLYSNLKHHNMKIGFAMFNLTRPNLSSSDFEFKLPIRYVGSFGIDLPIPDGFMLRPFTYALFYDDEFEWVGGASYSLDPNFINFLVHSFSVGAFIKIKNNHRPTHLIGQVGFKYNRFNFHLAYSTPVFNANNLPQQWQTLELTVVYNGFLSKLNEHKTPCNFY